MIEDGEIIRCDLSADGGEPGMRGRVAVRRTTQSGSAAKPASLEIASHSAQIGDLLDAIDEHRAPSVTAEDGRAALEIVSAVYEFARDGHTVRLPVPQPLRDRQPASS